MFGVGAYFKKEHVRAEGPYKTYVRDGQEGRKVRNHFCPTCGIHPLAEAKDPRTGKPTAAINVRCLEGIDLESLKIKKFNGRTL